MRLHYEKGTLNKEDLNPSPIVQFANWFHAAQESGITEVNAMVLSTATKAGTPSSRIVLLKEFSDSGFVFFTNYNSQKGREIAENPQVSLNFWWAKLERQVRIDGDVEKIPDHESDAYFNTRPEESRAGAIASPQSERIDSREWLEDRFQKIQSAKELRRPEHWGGYIVRPLKFEFWQGRPGRLHDRLQYSLSKEQTWVIHRLAP
jgi:pyridoxamine 5'-phosphate oxidase